MKLEEALRIFRIFSDRTRLRIFLRLLDSELCVGELMDLLQLEQSLISHQLRIMRQAGLVEARRNGRWIFYRIPAVWRKYLEPSLREWLKDELAQSGRKVKAVRNERVASPSRSESGGPKSSLRPKRRG